MTSTLGNFEQAISRPARYAVPVAVAAVLLALFSGLGTSLSPSLSSALAFLARSPPLSSRPLVFFGRGVQTAPHLDIHDLRPGSSSRSVFLDSWYCR